MNKRNDIIKSEKNLDKRDSERKARKHLLENPWFCNGYIYIKYPDISDLFIVENKVSRTCTDKEWADYFKTYLCDIKKFDKNEKVEKKWKCNYNA